jgi:site-specific DNA recombinase
MKKAIGYIRISTKDQSNFSISGQTDMITTFCQRNNYHLETIFIDDGKSAKNFDRPDWKKLETFIRKNHLDLDYLVMCKYDRFSRNTSEALQMLDLIEKKFCIKAMSVMEPIHVHPESPFFFQIRTQILTNAQVEWMIIRDRTRFGNHYAAKAGRYINMAPVGYKNARDESNKPIIIIDEAKAPIIRRMYQMLLQGGQLKDIYLEARRMGLPNRGHSECKRILQNPTYAGLVRVPSYNDEPETLTKGLHQALVDPATWYKAQDILNPKTFTRTVLNEEVPMRGVLQCFCHLPLTAGNSKGRKQYYWYYKCNQHTKINLSASKLHDQMEEVMKELSLPATYIDYLKEQVTQQLQQQQQDAHLLIQEKRRELLEITKKQDRLEEKFIYEDLDALTYQKHRDRLQREVAVAQKYILDFSTPVDQLWHLYEENFPKLGSMQYVWTKADLHSKQAILRQVFNSTLYYLDGCYRTAYLLPMFAPKALSLKEKKLLILEQPEEKDADITACAPHQSSIEHLHAFLTLLSTIKTA